MFKLPQNYYKRFYYKYEKIHILYINKCCPSPGIRIFTCYADRFEPQYGLESRFEALPKPGKSPNTPGGVTAKAVTPHPQLVNILIPSDSFK